MDTTLPAEAGVPEKSFNFHEPLHSRAAFGQNNNALKGQSAPLKLGVLDDGFEVVREVRAERMHAIYTL
jgi:hypothetical protein